MEVIMAHKKNHPPQRKIPVKPHERGVPTRKPPARPMPGQVEFSPDQEQAMRAGARSDAGAGAVRGSIMPRSTDIAGANESEDILGNI
jgi:hypothetical protein